MPVWITAEERTAAGTAEGKREAGSIEAFDQIPGAR